MRLLRFEMETDERLVAVGNCPFFAGGAPDALAALANASQMREFATGQTLFREGGPSDSFYVLATGRVTVSTMQAGRYAWLSEVRPYDPVGEIGAVRGAPRSATVTANSRVTAVRIDRDALWAVYDDHPRLMKAGFLWACEFAGRLTEREGIHALGLLERLAALLLSLAAPDGLIPVTQVEVAHRLGTRRETVVRLLRQFRQQGLVGSAAGKTRVLDRTGLEEIAHPH